MKTLAEENPNLYGTAYLAMKDTIDKARVPVAAHTEDDQVLPLGVRRVHSTPEDVSAEKAAAGTDTVVAPAVGAATPAAKGTGATKREVCQTNQRVRARRGLMPGKPTLRSR